MKDTLLHILTALTLHPESVEVNEILEEDERIIFMVKVHPEDMGRVIGKQGRIIRAIRDLMKVIATKEDKYVDVELVEETTSAQVSPLSPFAKNRERKLGDESEEVSLRRDSAPTKR